MRMAASIASAAFIVAVAGIFGALTTWGGSSRPERRDADDVLDLRTQPAEMVAQYRYIESHDSLASQVRCYCGCGPALDHQGLLDCFVIRAETYSGHASGCTVCTREAADVERLAAAGEDTRAIARWIDGEYAQCGAPTGARGDRRQ